MIRISGGQWRGRKLNTPHGDKCRPTADRVRESLFNILAPQLGQGPFLDLYSGSGAVGLEAASRGAPDVTLVEKEGKHYRTIKENWRLLEEPEQVRLWRGSVESYLKTGPFPSAVVFLDPPYREVPDMEDIFTALADHWLSPGGWLVLEHARRYPPPPLPDHLIHHKDYQYGDTVLSVWKHP